MTERKSSASKAQISGARVVPLHIETAKQFGGGSRGRTLAIIYRQMLYWSKYAKWKGKNGKKFFYKSAEELSSETSFSTKTIYRAIKALQELGLIIVEKIHKRYWRQVNFYYLPHSPFAAAAQPPERPEAVVVSTGTPTPVAAPITAVDAPTSVPKTTPNPTAPIRPSTAVIGAATGAGVPVHPAATAAATSIKTGRAVGFGPRVPIQQKEYKPLIKQTLQAVVEKCYAIADRMKMEQGQDNTSYAA